MVNLLSGLKADNAAEYNKVFGHYTDEEEDEDVSEFVGRRLSMN